MTGRKAEAWRLQIALAGLSALVIAVGWILFFWHAGVVRQSVLTQASETARNQSLVLREYADQALASAHIALRSLDVSPQTVGIQVRDDQYSNHLLLRRLRDSFDLFEGIGLLDVNGDLTANAEQYPPLPLNLGDRDYFRHHRDNAGRTMLIGEPVASRPRGVWAIPITRRIDNEDGSFAGVIAARLRPVSFERLFGLLGADTVFLFREDGLVLAAVPPLQTAARVEDFGLEIESGGTTRPDLVIGISRSADHPIGVAVSFDAPRLLAPIETDLARLKLIAIVSTAIIAFLTLLLIWRVRHQSRLADALEVALVSAEAANRSKSDFLAHMSHELRTPLNAIIGFAEISASEMFGPIGSKRYLEYATLIRQSGLHLLAIINNILDLAKVDAGKWEVSLASVSLKEILVKVLYLTKARAETHKIKLSFDAADDLPRIVTDERLLLQVLINLTTNAIKFTPAGGSVTVSARRLGDEVDLIVADTGTGMSAEDLAKVLKPFGHARSDLARQNHDTGLGLPLSKRFVELIGGRMEFDTASGRGTRVSVRIPISQPSTVPA